MSTIEHPAGPDFDDSALAVLLDADIDKVMSGLDRIVEAAPSYRKLFSRWEKQHWNSESFDLSQDRAEWESDLWTPLEREYMQWSLSSFFLGEERVTTELLPFAIAAPSMDARAFLCTQISDEARHMVFFDRFYKEVFGVDAATLADNLTQQRPAMNQQWGELFDGILHDCADALRRDPSDMDALVRGVTVYMVVIEGTLALTGARFILRYLKEVDRLPGFRQGFTAVNRDESRHVGFGVKFLADAIKEDPRHKQTVADTLQETLPIGTLALAPPMVDDPYSFTTPFGFRSEEIFEYAMKSLSKKLAAMGMEPLGAWDRRDAHGAARCLRTSRLAPEAGRARRGRPSSGARERILDAALEVLKCDGYAGLTNAKVAARSGENKALISYHFGSKQGLVAEVARAVSAAITDELLAAIGKPRNVRGLARGVADGLAGIMERDAGLARLYFDLASQSLVEPEVREIMAEMKAGYRAVLREQLARVTDGPMASADAAAAAVYLMACLEGLALEQLERGETPELRRARDLFVRSAPAVVGAR